ncbi:hypothetical protein RUM44_009448 [Polyplax serrata]|uniref:Uncharacterized protein n=1 Tax=Polyplax serrata TaxID=468196 RepID=A0ABR1ASQ4_POLSC
MAAQTTRKRKRQLALVLRFVRGHEQLHTRVHRTHTLVFSRFTQGQCHHEHSSDDGLEQELLRTNGGLWGPMDMLPPPGVPPECDGYDSMSLRPPDSEQDLRKTRETKQEGIPPCSTLNGQQRRQKRRLSPGLPADGNESACIMPVPLFWELLPFKKQNKKKMKEIMREKQKEREKGRKVGTFNAVEAGKRLESEFHNKIWVKRKKLSKQAKERNAPLKKKKISEIHQKKFPQASAKKTFRWKTCGTKAREAKDDDSNDGDGAGDGGCSDGGGGGGGASAAAPVADNRNEWKLAQGEK